MNNHVLNRGNYFAVLKGEKNPPYCPGSIHGRRGKPDTPFAGGLLGEGVAPRLKIHKSTGGALIVRSIWPAFERPLTVNGCLSRRLIYDSRQVNSSLPNKREGGAVRLPSGVLLIGARGREGRKGGAKNWRRAAGGGREGVHSGKGVV